MDQHANHLPELMTETEVIAYLRLDADANGRDPRERLRNAIRRQGLPLRQRGKIKRFRRAEVDAWLDGRKIGNPAR